MKNILLSIAFLLSGFGAFADHHEAKHLIKVNGMVCAFCVGSIEKKFSKMDEVKSIDVDLDSKLVTIVYKEGKSLEEERIRKIITESGFNISKIDTVN